MLPLLTADFFGCSLVSFIEEDSIGVMVTPKEENLPFGGIWVTLLKDKLSNSAANGRVSIGVLVTLVLKEESLPFGRIWVTLTLVLKDKSDLFLN